VTRVPRVLLPWTLAMIGAGAGVLSTAHAAGAPAAPAAAPAQPQAPLGPPDLRALEEMEKDVQHFATMVTEYRSTAREILKRAFKDKAKAINAKYDPQIDINDKQAREYRRDAIGMFEAFLLKYPNDKRWTPDAMFRLAELYYEKSAEEYLDADEAYKKALDTPSPPDTPPPRVDYTPTINLYRRLLTEFPSYRFLDAAYYLLGFCLGEMGAPSRSG
jgi:TolA-binding protein